MQFVGAVHVHGIGEQKKSLNVYLHFREMFEDLSRIYRVTINLDPRIVQQHFAMSRFII